MKTLSMRAWWAWALIHGDKRIENRNRVAHYRGPLAIHASGSRRGLREARERFPELPEEKDLIFGAVIGVVQLVDCLPVDQVREAAEARFGDLRFVCGPFCLVTAQPRALVSPLYRPGHLAMFETAISPALLPDVASEFAAN